MLLRAESLRPSSCSWGTQVAPNSKIKAAQTLVMSRVLTTNCIGPVCAVPSLLARLDDAPSLTRDEASHPSQATIPVVLFIAASLLIIMHMPQLPQLSFKGLTALICSSMMSMTLSTLSSRLESRVLAY